MSYWIVARFAFQAAPASSLRHGRFDAFHDISALVRQDSCSCLQAINDQGGTWCQVDVSGWLEAFAAHPRIGDVAALRTKFASERYVELYYFFSSLDSAGIINGSRRLGYVLNPTSGESDVCKASSTFEGLKLKKLGILLA